MKKFLMYVIIVVTCLFLGFTIYYLAQNKEKITMNIATDESIYINMGDSFALPIVWEDPYKDTKMTIAYEQSQLSYDEDTKMFTGMSGGFSSVTVTTTNKNFGPFIFEVYVGDGSVENPFAISGKKEDDHDITLDQIGTEKYPLNKSYMLIEDVEMASLKETWTPFGEFEGTFNGNGHTIHNLNVTTADNAGLFSKIAYNGIVENVKFANAKINGSFETAGVVAGINKGTIGKCQIISATISNTNETGKTGTIVGVNSYDSKPAIVNMCSVDSANVSGSGIVGGMIGENIASIILNSRALITKIEGTSESSIVGGIVGKLDTKFIENPEACYYSHISKVYSVLNAIEGHSTTVGAVVGLNESSIDKENDARFSNKFDNILFDTSAQEGLKAIGSSVYDLTESELEEFIAVTKEKLVNESTFKKYKENETDEGKDLDFDTVNVWVVDGTTYANINYNGNYESLRIVPVTSEIIDKQAFIDFLNAIIANPSLNKEFVVSQSMEIDIAEAFNGNNEWTTIAPNREEPLQASIIVAEGVICKISNFKLSGENTSFFGYIGGNSKIEGLTFGENIIVDNTNLNNTAIVATEVLTNGVLKNIKVTTADTLNGKTLTTSSKNVGIIAAVNNGSIIDCQVASESVLSMKVKATGNQGNIGGIAGFNQSLITRCSVNDVKLELDTSSSSTTPFNVGGVVGQTDSNITECGVGTSNEEGGFNSGFYFETTNSGVMYVGGIVGYTTNSTSIVISKNYAVATIKTSTTNSTSHLGGVVGYVSATTSVTLSSSEGSILKSYNVGGVASINNGTITTCYSNSALEGYIVAGLTVLNNNILTNCYTLSTLTGINENGSVNGITYRVPEGALVDKCFSSSTILGVGRKYAESESAFRVLKLFQNFMGLFIEDYKCGTVSNLIVINYGDATVQTVILSQRNLWWSQTWIEASEEECRGSDGYSLFINAGYDPGTWDFSKTDQYPTLINCAQPPVLQEEVVPETPENPEQTETPEVE